MEAVSSRLDCSYALSASMEGDEYSVRIHFRTPVPRTKNDRWDLDNLVKPTLDAMEAIFGQRATRGVPQANDDRVTHLEASKRTVGAGETEGATIDLWRL